MNNIDFKNNPSLLINENRIDIIIGIKYVEAYHKFYNTSFLKDLYIAYKTAFNNLLEPDNTKQNTYYKTREDFIKRFNTLINDIYNIKTNNTLIPTLKINNNYWIQDGFHRLSILYYFKFKYNISIIKEYNITEDILQNEIKKYKHPIPHYYPTNINFFKNKNLDEKYCNYTMEQYFKIFKKDFSCIILFPTNIDLPPNIYNEFKNDIIYKLEICEWNEQFTNNLIQLLYYDEEWCKKYYNHKAIECFKNKNDKLIILFTKKYNLSMLSNLKKKIRKFYNIGNNSIHTPDTQEECNNLLQLLTNNTISYMKTSSSLYIYYNNFNRLFNKLILFCKNNNIITDNICITGDSVLSLYNIKDCNNMEIFVNKEYEDIFKNSNFIIHNRNTLYNKHFEDIIHNPINYFYFKTMKFCCINIINKFNENNISYSNKILNLLNKYSNNNNFIIKKEINEILKLTENNIAVIILWNTKYEKNILDELDDNNLSIIYKKNIKTTMKFTENLLRQIHYGKEWWDNNIIEETNKRFNNNLTYYIIYGNKIHNRIRELKNNIRNKYNFDKTIFHFSDPDCSSHIGIKCNCKCNKIDFNNEIYKHIHLLMNKNTLHFLFNASFKKNYNIYSYLKKYNKIFKKQHIDHDKYIIDNSAVLALYGLRDAGDLDFITVDDEINYKQLEIIEIDCMNKLHLSEFNKMNLSISDLLFNPNNHFYFNNNKIISLSILKKFKYNRTINIINGEDKIRKKDIDDYNLIQ